MNKTEKVVLEALKCTNTNSEIDLDSVAAFIVKLAELGHAVKPMTDKDYSEI